MFVVEATDGSPSSVRCQGDQDIGPDLTREGPFFWFFRTIAYYYVINLIGVYNSWVYLCGAGCPVGSNLLSGSLVCGGPCYSTQGIPWKCH